MTMPDDSGYFHCTGCKFTAFKLKIGQGYYTLTCSNCLTQYIISTVLGQVQTVPELTNAKQ